jgi:hypothetical protein
MQYYSSWVLDIVDRGTCVICLLRSQRVLPSPQGTTQQHAQPVLCALITPEAHLRLVPAPCRYGSAPEHLHLVEMLLLVRYRASILSQATVLWF